MTDNLEKVRFTYLDYLFKEIYWVKSKHYPDSTFFKNDDKVILELEKSGTLWVLYSVWSNISDMFSFDYNETQKLIKEWMEAQLKSREVTPLREQFFYKPLTEERLKSLEVEPLDAGSNYLPFMEKQLKSGEIEPDCNFNTNIIRVQEELKQEEVTPRNAIAPPFRWRKLDSVKYAEIKPTFCGPIYRSFEEVTPTSTKYVSFKMAEQRLKSGEIEPVVTMPLKLEVVEERLKSAEIIPKKLTLYASEYMGKKIKSEEITPRQVVTGSFDWVEEQTKQI